jgi:phosphocarrier protein HPr
MTHRVAHRMIVTDPIGLHARPVGQVVSLVKTEEVQVFVKRPDGPEVAAVSALRLLAMKIKVGEEIDVIVEADSEERASRLAADIETLINQG